MGSDRAQAAAIREHAVELERELAERKCAQKSLLASEQRCKDFAEAAADWFWEMDADLRFSYISDHLFKSGGGQLENLLGKTWQDADVVCQDNETWRRHLACLKSRRAFREFQYSCVMPDGLNRHYSTSGIPIFDQANEFKGYRGIGVDITERMQAEEALKSSERDSLERLLELEQSYIAYEAQGADLAHWVEERTAKLTRVNEDLETEIAGHRRTEELLLASERVLQERVAELEEAKYKLEMQGDSLARLADDLRNARDEARAADRAKSEFLAAMSHELRTPLNAIIGFSEIIKNEILGTDDGTKYREYASDINESGQHLLSLINDILDLSKVESGSDELHEDIVRIAETLRPALMLVGQRAVQGGVKLELDLPDQLPALRADERKLKQILVNLLSNAVKFTEAGGEVTLSAWCRADSGHVFQIVDTGIGIAPEDIPNALSRFGQVESALNRRYAGTGLGLPLAKALVELHGGELVLRSEVGVGTTVMVCFPAERTIPSLDDLDSLVLGDRAAS